METGEFNEDETDLRDKLWDVFDTIPDTLKVAWLLEFNCVFETVRDWDEVQIKAEIERLEELKKVDFSAIIDKNKEVGL